MEEKKDKPIKPPTGEVTVQVIHEGGGFVRIGERFKTTPTTVEDTRGMWVGDVFYKTGSKFKTTEVKAKRWAAKGLVKILK